MDLKISGQELKNYFETIEMAYPRNLLHNLKKISEEISELELNLKGFPKKRMFSFENISLYFVGKERVSIETILVSLEQVKKLSKKRFSGIIKDISKVLVDFYEETPIKPIGIVKCNGVWYEDFELPETSLGFFNNNSHGWGYFVFPERMINTRTYEVPWEVYNVIGFGLDDIDNILKQELIGICERYSKQKNNRKNLKKFINETFSHSLNMQEND
jgi:hypothetical protein